MMEGVYLGRAWNWLKLLRFICVRAWYVAPVVSDSM